MDFVEVGFGAIRYLSDNEYPRKTWWKFWERKRTRSEYLADEHRKRLETRECHIWEDKEFHFCRA
jgi:hypothetical protein